MGTGPTFKSSESTSSQGDNEAKSIRSFHMVGRSLTADNDALMQCSLMPNDGSMS